jgi:hypothetical protein
VPHTHPRPDGFAENVLRQWRLVGQKLGLTEHETVVLAAQFTGLAAVECVHTVDGLEGVLDLASRAMNTAAVGKLAVRMGHGHPAKRRP